MVKYAAFMPPDDLRTSVYRVDGLDGGQVRQLASATSRKGSFKGHGLFSAAAVRSVSQLDVVPEMTHHPLHADIVGWPAEREKRIELAQMLAVKAEFVPRAPEPSSV